MASNKLFYKKGIDILADIMSYMEPMACERLLKNLQVQVPAIASELQKRLFTFSDLAFANSRGIQKLIKLISLKDLAMALKGADELVLKNFASNMSQNAIQMLKEEIIALGPRKKSEVEDARAKILSMARQLMQNNELYIQKSCNKDQIVY